MNYDKFNTNWNKPAVFTAQTYGTKITVEIDHSDLDLDEVMNSFETLVIGMGYHKDAWKNWIIEEAEDYKQLDKNETNSDEYDDDYFNPNPNDVLIDAKKQYDEYFKNNNNE